MPAGLGRYGHIAEEVMKKTDASTVIVMVISGSKGHGFNIASDIPDFHLKIPKLLRATADEIEKENALQDN